MRLYKNRPVGEDVVGSSLQGFQQGTVEYSPKFCVDFGFQFFPSFFIYISSKKLRLYGFICLPFLPFESHKICVSQWFSDVSTPEPPGCLLKETAGPLLQNFRFGRSDGDLRMCMPDELPGAVGGVDPGATLLGTTG